MREVLAFVVLLGYWVVIEGAPGRQGGEGVVDSVISASPGILITFADGCSVHIPDPGECAIGVYRKAPGKIPMPDAQ
jgi:hypothetical protein